MDVLIYIRERSFPVGRRMVATNATFLIQYLLRCIKVLHRNEFCKIRGLQLLAQLLDNFFPKGSINRMCRLSPNNKRQCFLSLLRLECNASSPDQVTYYYYTSKGLIKKAGKINILNYSSKRFHLCSYGLPNHSHYEIKFKKKKVTC